MNAIDTWFARLSRNVARRSSRRGFLARLGAAIVGAATLPLLPVARADAAARVPVPGEPDPSTAAGDPADCQYWRHCAIDGFLCSCCGGTQHSCPPGTEMSPVTWIGTCRNPADNKDYIISYNDCCGKYICGLCFCHRNKGDKPIYEPPRSNDINWCFGTKNVIYNCSTAIVLGIAAEEKS
jgi:methylamine dehydrogenase light chain